MTWKGGVKNRVMIKKIKFISWWRSIKKDPYGILWVVPFNNFGKGILACTSFLNRIIILACTSPDIQDDLTRFHELTQQFKEAQNKFDAFWDWSFDIDDEVPYPITETLIETSRKITQLAYTLNQQGFEDALLKAFCPDLLYIRYLARI